MAHFLLTIQRKEYAMIGNLTKGSLLLYACLFTTQMAYAAPNLEEVRIEGITSAGTGCPLGSTATNLSPDRKEFSIIFDEFLAEIGAGASSAESKKYCRVTLELTVPQGWSFTLHEVTHRGFYSLESGIQATHRRAHWIQNLPFKRKRFHQNFQGVLEQDYRLDDAVPVKILSFGCGRTKTINIDIKIGLKSENPSSNGIMTLDSLDGKLTRKRGVTWKRCEPL